MLNHIVIMGRLTRDPELRRTGSGIAVTSFTLAVDRDYNSKESGERETDFIDCVAWRSTGEFVSKYFAKGRMAVVSGRLQIRSWTDKDGNKRRSAEVVADNVYFGESKRDESSAPYGGNAYGSASGITPPPAPGYGGYSAPAPTYSAPSQSASDFAMLDDNDAQLPF
ncbi:MAG TPA: single-stranded DNA-binding protein [Candidatus Faecousia excrementipullorum]|nr:single-stranded DNA-binding protein [Candidatus Faecousia excrementipullorum]